MTEHHPDEAPLHAAPLPAPDGDDIDLFAQARRRSRRRLFFAAAAAALLVVGGAILVGADVRPRYEARHAVEPQLFGAIDMRGLHARLLPSWAIAATRLDSEAGRAREAAAFGELRDAVATDANLTQLLVDLRDVVRGDLVADAGRAVDLTADWTDYMRAKGVPYVVAGNVMSTPSGAFFYAKIYRVVAETDVRVGEATYPARLVTRADRTNVREQYLGATSKGQGDAVVVIDRILDFAMRDVWPLLDPELDAGPEAGPEAGSSPFAPAVRAEAAAALDPAALRILRETAASRRRILEAVEAVNARAHCDSGFGIQYVPPRGFEARDRQQLERVAEASEGDQCPALTFDELEALVEGSEELADADGLEAALEALVAWISRAITVHEARHVADDVLVDGLETPLPCEACPPGASVRAEMSAYLASFGWAKSPATALFQACGATEGEGGVHAVAMRALLDHVGQSCPELAADPAALRQRARELEARLFGRSEPVALPQSYPATLVLEAR